MRGERLEGFSRIPEPTPAEMQNQLECMADPSGDEAWVLSENDKKAIAWALKRIVELEKAYPK